MRGSCLCGGVTFEVTEQFSRVSFCHCTTCKAISGGVGSATGRVPTSAINVLTGRDLITTYQPHEGTAKSFCSVCGTNLFGTGWPDSEVTGVRLTTLDEPYEGTADMHIFVRSVAPWETLPDDGLPRHDEQAS
jgi:hypothetical protein